MSFPLEPEQQPEHAHGQRLVDRRRVHGDALGLLVRDVARCHAILGLRLVERGFERQAAVAGFEFILERARMLDQLLRCDLMHGIGDVPEPEVGFGQGAMQRLRACDRK